MQDSIDEIVYSDSPNPQKLDSLKSLFSKHNIELFCDFDDTITSNKCVFYTKFKFLRNYKRLSIDDASKVLLADFDFNIDFIKVLDKFKSRQIIILSRNNHEFLKNFLKNSDKYLKDKDFKIIGVVGITESFIIDSKDKLDIVGPEGYLISDIFEYKALKSSSNFLCVDNIGYFNFARKIFYKCLRLFIFLLKNV